jgi:hypothetical protein
LSCPRSFCYTYLSPWRHILVAEWRRQLRRREPLYVSFCSNTLIPFLHLSAGFLASADGNFLSLRFTSNNIGISGMG